MAREQDGRTGLRRVEDQGIDQVPARPVEPGMGLVEQPQLGPTSDERGQRRAPTLTRREPCDRDRGHASIDPASGQRAAGVDVVGAGGAGPEVDVVDGGQVGVQAVIVGEQADPAADRPGVGRDVHTEDPRLAAGHPSQPGTGTQQRRLPGAVGTAKQDDLALTDRQVDASESGKPVEEHDCGLQHDRIGGDRGRHTELTNATEGTSAPPRRGPRSVIDRRRRSLFAVRLARLLGGVGRLLIWAGVITLLFVAYQLWGTNLAEARAQNGLEDDFESLLEETTTTTSTTTTSTPEPTTTTTTEPLEPPEPGEPVARIEIPDIGVDKIVVEGVERDDLQKGPGHYPQTPLPGQSGNAAIAGHRTTYGAPFHNVDQLEEGDTIRVTTAQGSFTYEVTEQMIVSPTDVEVIEDQGDDRLTLTSCHPKYSASQRIIISALLVDDPAPPTPRAERSIEPVETIDGEERGSIGPVIVLGLIALAVWLFFYWLSRRWRRWPAYLLGVAPFAIALFVWFGAVAELLPTGY